MCVELPARAEEACLEHPEHAGPVRREDYRDGVGGDGRGCEQVDRVGAVAPAPARAAPVPAGRVAGVGRAELLRVAQGGAHEAARALQCEQGVESLGRERRALHRRVHPGADAPHRPLPGVQASSAVAVAAHQIEGSRGRAYTRYTG